MDSIIVKSLNVLPLSRSEFAISWEFEPTISSFADFDFVLEKSNAPHDGFELLARISPKEKHYIDNNVAIFKLWKNYYVRMRITDKSSGESYFSDCATTEHPPSIEALELIRRTKITLENPKFGNGVPCKVWLRKEGGQRCVECYDSIKKRSTKTNCINCYGTTYDGGYYKAVTVYMNFSVDIKSMGVSDTGNIINSANRVMTGNFPILKPGDVVADPRLNRVWVIVGDINNVERRRHIIKQIATLKEEERTSVLFELLKREE